MECPVCDHVDVAGHGLEPNAALTLTITDVKSGQTVLPETRVSTDSSGSFSREFDMDLAKHPTLLANLYEPSGSTLVLAAHANASAPAHCRRDASLPYTGSHAGLSGRSGRRPPGGRRRPPADHPPPVRLASLIRFGLPQGS